MYDQEKSDEVECPGCLGQGEVFGAEGKQSCPLCEGYLAVPEEVHDRFLDVAAERLPGGKGGWWEVVGRGTINGLGSPEWITMNTVFSHIVQKRLSQENEDVATDALCFILHSSESARKGMMKLLRGIVGDMPDLRFRTQQAERGTRPDMSGFDGADLRVLIENKFWAGLTDQQPVSYLEKLAEYAKPTVLLVVAPAAREQAIWRELLRRLGRAEIAALDRDVSDSIVRCVETGIGPYLALTSWRKLLSTLDSEVRDDQGAKNDLLQLGALCDAADGQAFAPISAAELSDQRIPAFILQLNTIIQDSVQLAVTEGALNLGGLRPQASWDRSGRYIRFVSDRGVGAWFGVRFDLWQQHGATPLWLVFSPTEFSRALEVEKLIEPWADREGLLHFFENSDVEVGVDLPTGEEKARVVRTVADFLKQFARILSALDEDAVGQP